MRALFDTKRGSILISCRIGAHGAAERPEETVYFFPPASIFVFYWAALTELAIHSFLSLNMFLIQRMFAGEVFGGVTREVAGRDGDNGDGALRPLSGGHDGFRLRDGASRQVLALFC